MIIKDLASATESQQSYRLILREILILSEQLDKDPNAYFWLSRVLAAKGEMKEAIINLDKAINLSSALAQNNKDYFQRILEQYKTQLD